VIIIARYRLRGRPARRDSEDRPRNGTKTCGEVTEDIAGIVEMVGIVLIRGQTAEMTGGSGRK